MVNFMHELEQSAEFPLRKTFALKPGEIVAREICKEPALVFAKRHLHGAQLLQILRIHPRNLSRYLSRRGQLEFLGIVLHNFSVFEELLHRCANGSLGQPYRHSNGGLVEFGKGLIIQNSLQIVQNL